MSSRQADFFAGIRDISPFLLGAIPFGLVVGVGMVGAGIPRHHAIAMSAFVFGGASQLAAADLVGNHAPPLLIVTVALAVNLRFMMYSVSIAPHFQRLTTRWKWFISAFLVDMNYALSVTRFTDEEPVDPRWYYLGASLPLWAVWMVATVVGVVVGTQVPGSLQLEFATTLIFVALAVGAIEDRSTAAAALAAGLLAIPGLALPFEAGLLPAAIGGVAVGMIAAGRAD